MNLLALLSAIMDLFCELRTVTRKLSAALPRLAWSAPVLDFYVTFLLLLDLNMYVLEHD
jgi:hypothetical protein